MDRCTPALDHLIRAVELVETSKPASQGETWIDRDTEVFSRVRAAECLIRLQRRAEARSEITRVLEITNCEDCETRSREIDRSKSKAEELLQQLDTAAPADAQAAH